MLVLSSISTAITIKARGSSFCSWAMGAQYCAVNGGMPWGMFFTILMGPLPFVQPPMATTAIPMTQARNGPNALR